ncbi:host specificity protein, partial [Pseudomonas monteilii]
MYLQFLDAAGAVLSAPSTSGKPVLGESFTRYTLTGTAPANATQVNVYVCRLFNDSNTTATLWAEIDNVQLQEGLVATAYQPSIVAAADASAEAVTSLGARVEKNEQGLKSSGEQVTRLTNSLTITDGNVDKAQKAAQDAYGLADGKGKVIVQNAAPAAADRLAQNLWIDTTGGANTPKRWSGSAWTAVTDKVALDAAAAAQNALNQLGGKADASALSALGSTVEQQGRDITAAGQSITRIDASIASAGSENLLFNPSFDKVASQTDRAPVGWGWGNSGGTVTRSFVPSSLDPAGQALRFNFAGFSESSNYIDLIPSTDVAISAGQVVTLSAYFKLTAGCYVRLYLQPKNAAGAVIETHTSAVMYGTDQWSRATFEGRVMPAGTVSVIVRLRVFGGATQALQSGYAEWDRTQLEVSPVATGWRDNGLVNAADSAANAAAVVAITGRVEKTEQGLTSTSGSITQLENSIGDIGGENLFYNPAMTKYAGLNGAAEGWQIEGSVNSIDTLIQSWLNSAEKAQRIEVPSGLTTSGASPTGYKSLRPALSGAVIKRPKIAGGEPFTASAYVRATSGLGCRIYLQWLNSSGAVINAPASALFSLSPTSSRIEYSAVAPADAVECNVYYRVFSISGAVSSGFMELARPQMEHGARATGWRDNGQVVSAEQAATATAVDRLVTTVDQQGKDLTSYSTRTTTLENNLTTASGNVDKAQKAAQDAYSLADAKGKVIVQSSAPSAINQQIQNLWIDTTGGANTPKRWNGSAWMAVTDKVALDAAAAAQSALNQLGSKADAKAVTDLTTRVKDTEDGLSSQAGQLTQLSSSIGSAQPFVAGYSW